MRARNLQFCLRRELGPGPCTRVVQFCLRRELPEPGARNFACGANTRTRHQREAILYLCGE